MSQSKLKDSFEVESKIEAFYRGGDIEWSDDGETFFCQNGDCITIVSATKGSVKISIGKTNENEDPDIINSFTSTKDGKFIVTHHKSSLFKLWSLEDAKLVKLWKSIHNGPVATIVIPGNLEKMASGGTDGTVRLWNLERNTCTLSLKGAEGVIGTLCYQTVKDKELIFASGNDNDIHAWNIHTGKKEIILHGHMSQVTSLMFHKDGVHAVSCGRDKVLILWDLVKKASVRVLPVYECLEGAFIIPDHANFPKAEVKSESIYVASAGERGFIKIWDMISGQMVYEQKNSLIENSQSVSHLLYNESTNSIGVVSTSHNILIYALDNFECKKQYVGYIDQVLDIVYFGKNESHLAVATNTEDIKVYDLSTMSCKILCGHTKIVYSLATSRAKPNILISSSQDCTVKLWLMDEETKNVNCIGTGTAHLESVTYVTLPQVNTYFFVTVAKDMCLKLWDLPTDLTYTGTEIPLKVSNTVVAHPSNKKIDINCVAISPNAKLIATSAQDKLAKLWCADTLILIGTFTGHRKGVWCVKFHPMDQVLLTSSADCTIKMWHLETFTCLATFEGHECSVLRVNYLCDGYQVLSTGTDGLIKLWSTKTFDCILTLDEHQDKAWALAVNESETHFVTGGGDSKLIIWKDMTTEKKEKALALAQQMTLDEQKLANFLQVQKLSKALKLALKLQKPMHVLRIIETLIKKGDDELTSTISDLKPLQQEELLNCAVVWNTNARTCHPAQVVLNTLLTKIDFDTVKPGELRSKLEALIPYTDRHFRRITKLHQDLHLLKFTVNSMKSHNTANEQDEM